MIKLFKKHRKNRLKDSDVREIAKMSAQLNTYHQVLFAISQAIRDRKNAGDYTKNIIVTPLDDNDKHFINDIIDFIDLHKNKLKKKKTL